MVFSYTNMPFKLACTSVFQPWLNSVTNLYCSSLFTGQWTGHPQVCCEVGRTPAHQEDGR